MSALPIIHTNGTSAQMLLDGYLNAYTALGDAHRAMEAIEFNARDYYVAGPHAWKAAVAERHDQYEALAKLRLEMMAIVEHCQDAIDAKERQMASRLEVQP